jgi:hypothetical protein
MLSGFVRATAASEVWTTPTKCPDASIACLDYSGAFGDNPLIAYR